MAHVRPSSSLPFADRSEDAADGIPAVLSPVQVRAVLLGLVLLALLPRAVAAWRLNAVCDDAYFYQWAATMWEQGRTDTALKYLNINVYPWILWGLNAAGLPWPLSGKLWGVLVSTLAVLPLFGLMRRLFDDRVAAVSAFLYAIHPRLIELSAEPIREPTFWFLFLLSAYWIYRAATESRGWRHAVAAGIATSFAVHTRTEGWALLVLLFAWPLALAPTQTSRLRRLSRIALMLAMIPAFLIAANLTLLRDHDRWEWGRFAPLRGLVEWLQPLSLDDSKPEAQAKALLVRPSPALFEFAQSSVPEGRSDSSPAIHRRVSTRHERSPAGTAEVFIRPFGTAQLSAFCRAMNRPASIVASLRDGKSATSKLAIQASMGGPFASGSAQHSAQPGASAPRLMGDGNVRPPAEIVAALAQLDGLGRPSYAKPAAYVFVNSFAEKLGYVNLVLLLIGCICMRSEMFDRQRWPLLVVFGGILLAVWVRLSHFGDINGRYFLTAYLVALPTEAVGLLFVMQRLRSRFPWRTLPASAEAGDAGSIPHGSRLPAVAPVTLLLVLTAAFWFQAFTRQHSGRERQSELGRRIRERLGPVHVVEVDRQSVRVGHFALGELPSVKYDDEGDGPPPPPPDVIIATTPLQPAIRERAKRHGLVEVARDELTVGDTQFHIFARPAMHGERREENSTANRTKRREWR